MSIAPGEQIYYFLARSRHRRHPSKEGTIDQLENALRSLTTEVCRQLEGQEILKRPVWTVVGAPDSTPYVALDAERPAFSDLRYGLTIGLLQMPAYTVAADAVENEAELAEGIIVDAGGYLQRPERINLTRALVTNFLWRYLREGKRLDWDKTRYTETFNELRQELRRKTIVLHTTLPLSNLRMDIAELDFGDELKLLPASIEEA